MYPNKTNQNIGRFFIYGTVYTQTEGQQKQLLYQNAQIFIQQQQKYYFNIVILNCLNQSDQKVYKLQVDYQAFYEIVKDVKSKLFFHIPLKKNQNLIIEALFQDSEIQRLGQFREFYCRAVFEEKQEQSSQYLSNEELDKEVFIYMQKQSEDQKESELIKKLEQELNKEKSFIFFGVGYLARGNETQDPQIIAKPAVFAIKMNGFNKYKIIVYDESQQIQYSKDINFLLQRQIEEIELSFMWIDEQFDTNLPQIYYFQFQQGDVNMKKLDDVLKRMDYETDRNQGYNTNNDFMQYYGGNANPGMFYNQQIPNNQNFQFQFQQNTNPNESVLDVNNDFIKEFQQLKTKNKILINKNQGLEIVDNQQLQVQQDFQLRDQNNNIFQPDNIHMLDHDNKFISQGPHKSDRVFYTDLNSEKVIREYKDKKGQIQDLTAHGGKEAVFGNDNTFLTLSNQNITHFDPRQEKPVSERFYKTVKNLTNIYAPQEGQFVIASDNGDLRTYNKVGGNARNVIPSYTQSKPLQIDSDKTGHLILVTYETHLQLIPMKQDGESAFKKTFKKTEKPKPFNLKIHPKILAKYKMSKPKFKSAKFDEKLNQNESAIIAVCGQLQVFWNLNDVLRGETVTSNVQKLNEEILKSEFQFNGDKTFTAFKKKLILSQCGKFN